MMVIDQTDIWLWGFEPQVCKVCRTFPIVARELAPAGLRSGPDPLRPIS